MTDETQKLVDEYKNNESALSEKEKAFIERKMWVLCPNKKDVRIRSYMTRHGVGPFVSENNLFDGCSENDHNRTGEWQGTFRSGAFDLVSTKYALDAIGRVDGFVMTHLDRLNVFKEIPVCIAYEGMNDIQVKHPFDLAHQEQLTKVLMSATPIYDRFNMPSDQYSIALSNYLGVPLHSVSRGPTARDKVFVTKQAA